MVVVGEGRDILFLSVSDNCTALGTVFGNMERRGDNQDARCMDYGKRIGRDFLRIMTSIGRRSQYCTFGFCSGGLVGKVINMSGNVIWICLCVGSVCACAFVLNITNISQHRTLFTVCLQYLK
jgi:hypothetical protein